MHGVLDRGSVLHHLGLRGTVHLLLLGPIGLLSWLLNGHIPVNSEAVKLAVYKINLKIVLQFKDIWVMG